MNSVYEPIEKLSACRNKAFIDSKKAKISVAEILLLNVVNM